MNSLSTNPFSWLAPQYEKKMLWLSGVLTVLLLLVLGQIDQPLRTLAAPNGIVSFELSKSLAQAQQILTSWNSTAKMFAALSLGLDFLFLLTYSLFLSLAAFKIAKMFVGTLEWLARIGNYLVWFPLIAALFDVLENCFLIALLTGSQNKLFPLLAYYSSTLKFTLIFLAIIYIIVGLLMRFAFRKRF